LYHDQEPPLLDLTSTLVTFKQPNSEEKENRLETAAKSNGYKTFKICGLKTTWKLSASHLHQRS